MKLKMVWKDFLDLFLRREYAPEIVPVQELVFLDEGLGQWQATGPDPQALLVGDLPAGLCEVVLIARADRSTIASICLDRGSGFNLETYSPLGIVGPELKVHQGYVQLKPPVKAVRFDPVESPCRLQIASLTVRRISRLEIALRVMAPWMRRVGMRPEEFRRAIQRLWPYWKQAGLRGIWHLIYSRIAPETELYQAWLEKFQVTPERRERMLKEISAFSYQPTISILMPVFDPEEKWLKEAIDSVLEQVYPNWELCIADDASSRSYVRRVLEAYQSQDARIKVEWRAENGHIAAASNSALKLATGEFVATLDHDDLLTPDALFQVVKRLNSEPELDMIYSDEDKVSEGQGRHAPYFKPDWSPDLFLSQMYTAHLAVYRRSLIAEIGGFRPGFDGAQDYDLVLRLTERTQHIGHIPKVLYSWRRTAGSTALMSSSKTYAYLAAQHALEQALERRGELGVVKPVSGHPGHFTVHRVLRDQPLTSIVILTKDRPEILNQCLQSIFKRSTYRNFEIILIDNGSQEEKTIRLLARWAEREPKRFRMERIDAPFNFSALNNRGVQIARGTFVLLLNNDTEVISPDWLQEMAAQAARPEIGAVGAMLLFPNDTIQHAGIVLGIGEWAGHSHKGMPVDIPGYGGRLLGPSNYAAVTAACLMIRKELFLSLGGFDESLAVACGDVELCLRVLERGLYNVVLPHVRLYHYESATRGYEDSPQKRERFRSEIAYVRDRWADLLDEDPFYNPNLTHEREDFSLAAPSDLFDEGV